MNPSAPAEAPSRTISSRQKGKPNLRLLRARMERGVSRAELSSMTGLSVKQIGLIERGVARRSRAETLKTIAEALELDVLALFPERGRRL